MQNHIKQILIISFGVIMIAAGIHFFLLPSNLALGGATGMALLVAKFLPLPVGPLLVIVNIILFILGFLVIGNKFGVKTVLASLGLSAMVWLFQIFMPVSQPIVKDSFLQLIVAVLLYGSGVGIVLNHYASTGGSDIISMIIQKYTGADLGKGCLLTDFTITAFMGLMYGGETALYSLVGVIINGLVIDATINGLNSSRYCIINTSNSAGVCELLISIGRSGNVYSAKGAYRKNEQDVVHTVLSRRDFVKLKKYLAENDPEAFVVVSNAHSVFGYHWRKIKD